MYSSVCVIAFCMELTVRSQGMIKLDQNVRKAFEILYLSKTWSEIVLIHSARVI
jgi:hypothetical protein